MAKKKKKNVLDTEWAKAKKVCRLNQEDIRMAKELGFKPKSLLKNNPSPSQPWKLPVKAWIHELYEKRFGRRSKKEVVEREPSDTVPEGFVPDDEDDPYWKYLFDDFDKIPF